MRLNSKKKYQDWWHCQYQLFSSSQRASEGKRIPVRTFKAAWNAALQRTIIKCNFFFKLLRISQTMYTWVRKFANKMIFVLFSNPCVRPLTHFFLLFGKRVRKFAHMDHFISSCKCSLRARTHGVVNLPKQLFPDFSDFSYYLKNKYAFLAFFSHLAKTERIFGKFIVSSESVLRESGARTRKSIFISFPQKTLSLQNA